MKNEVIIRHEISGLPELVQALNGFVAAMSANAQLSGQAVAPAETMTANQTAPTVPQSPSSAGVPTAATIPVQPPVPTQPSVPVAPVPAQTPAIPTTNVAVTYTTDALAVAASQLVNAGKQQKLIEILNGFGVSTLMDLSPEQYGAFAAAIKKEGATL